jgi:hypothetical protein
MRLIRKPSELPVWANTTSSRAPDIRAQDFILSNNSHRPYSLSHGDNYGKLFAHLYEKPQSPSLFWTSNFCRRDHRMACPSMKLLSTEWSTNMTCTYFYKCTTKLYERSLIIALAQHVQEIFKGCFNRSDEFYWEEAVIRLLIKIADQTSFLHK